jgi:hypothetical protein
VEYKPVKQLDQEIEDGTMTPYSFGDYSDTFPRFIDLLGNPLSNRPSEVTAQKNH